MTLERDAYEARWSAAHGGVAPVGLVGAWLGVAYRLGVLLVRAGVAPWAVSLVGVALAVAAVPVAAQSGWAAAGLIALSGCCDGLDGTVALLTGRASRRGAVLDAVCDRVSDLCLPGALWLAGAPPWLCLGAAAIAWGHEYLRAVAGVAGMREVGSVTVGERPTRIIVIVAFLLAETVVAGGRAAGAGALALVVIGAVGLVQLGFAVRRCLS